MKIMNTLQLWKHIMNYSGVVITGTVIVALWAWKSFIYLLKIEWRESLNYLRFWVKCQSEIFFASARKIDWHGFLIMEEMQGENRFLQREFMSENFLSI